jgi:hypothetical protein
MNIFEKPILEKIPFAIIRYSEWLITDKESANSRYELIKIKNVKEKEFVMDGELINNSHNTIIGTVLTERQIKYFKSIQNKFTKAVSNSHGTVWEFNNFKQQAKKLNVKL